MLDFLWKRTVRGEPSRTMNGVFTQSAARNDSHEAFCHLEPFGQAQGKLRERSFQTEPLPTCLFSRCCHRRLGPNFSMQGLKFCSAMQMFSLLPL